MHRRLLLLAILCVIPVVLVAQDCTESGNAMDSAMTPHNYILKRASSYDRTGGNADARQIPAGETLTILDEAGPGLITHFWATIAAPNSFT